MKIAVTYDNGNIFQHFGRTESFKVYEVEDNKVISSEVIGSNGIGHGALAGLLADKMGMELEIVDTTEENLLKSLDGEVYDCVLSFVGLSQWNTIHYGHTQPYLDLSSIEKGSGDEEDTRIAAFTKKGNSLADTLEENLEELKEDGTLSQLSSKYFGEDLTI